ncbi:hypothetical protein HK104_007514, partial [Borealophlyctis nickersoniae]
MDPEDMDADPMDDAVGGNVRRWVSLLPRGGCPFDVKAYHAQAAGFSGVVVYNNGSGLERNPGADLFVRMSGNKVGGDVDVLAMFVTYRGGKVLRDGAAATVVRGKGHGGQEANKGHLPATTPHQHQYPAILISIASTRWGFTPSSPDFSPSLLGIWTDLVFLLAVAILCGFTFLLICVLATIGRNLILYRRFFPENVNAPRPLGKEGVKRLDSVTLPLRVLTEEDFADEGGDGAGGEAKGKGKGKSCVSTPPKVGLHSDCCAICIDEFVPGSR